MEPIMKLLEEDEDDSLHSGAAVEAFTAALNRDIEGNTSVSHSASEAQGNNQMSSLYSQWQPHTEDGTGNFQRHTDMMCVDQQQAENSGELDVKPYISGAEIQQQEASAPHAPNELLLQKTQDNDHNNDQKEGQKPSVLSQSSGMQNLDKGRRIQEPRSSQNPSREAQLLNMPSQSDSASEEAIRTIQRPFASILPFLLPQLDKDRGMQVQSLFDQLKKNEVPRDDFKALVKNIAGIPKLNIAYVKMRAQIARESQLGLTQQQLHSQNQMQQHSLPAPTRSGNDLYQFAHLHQRSQDANGMQVNQMSIRPAKSAVNSSSAAGSITQASAVSSFKRQKHAYNDSKRLPAGSISHMPNNSTGQKNISLQTSASEDHKFGAPSSMYVKHESADPTNEHQSKLPLTSSHGSGFLSTTAGSQNSMLSPTSTDFQTPSSSVVMPGSNTKAAPKKSRVGQKKPIDAVGSSPPLPSKKQKASGAFSDQSIEHLNDVTAVSGVNLREEEEQLFSGPKEDPRASEASHKIVQEEEDKLLLEKLPLKKKLAEIMRKCGIKNVSNDVERCLSLCVEERLGGLLSSVIRVSRQRADSEKSRHRTVVTSDVRQQILAINRKARERREKEQAEAEKLMRLNELDSGMGIEGDKEKDENCAKLLKMKKEEDEKRAANVAARAAVGGDDMLSKWQLMAEQAHQKREGGSEPNIKSSSTPSMQTGRRHGRNQSSVDSIITVEDVIAVLEKEPQMAKSTILYRLYHTSKQNKG